MPMTDEQIIQAKRAFWRELNKSNGIAYLCSLDGELCHSVVAGLAWYTGLCTRYNERSVCEYAVADAFMREYRPDDPYTRYCHEPH